MIPRRSSRVIQPAGTPTDELFVPLWKSLDKGNFRGVVIAASANWCRPFRCDNTLISQNVNDEQIKPWRTLGSGAFWTGNGMHPASTLVHLAGCLPDCVFCLGAK